MGHRTDKHLEHAEHVQHHAHDPFDRRVAMSMAIVAAALACAGMLSHRAHIDTLKLHILSNNDNTAASNRWGYYQAKKNREYMYAADAALLTLMVKDSSKADAAKQAEKQIADWKSKVEEYKKDTKAIEQEARELDDHAKELGEQAETLHHRVDRIDYGHLGLDLSLVLCSIAVLTKQRRFWYSGVLVGLVGAVVVFSSFFMH